MAALTVEQESDSIAALCYWFSLAELEDLAFDLGLGFEVFALETKEDLARSMFRAVSIMGREGCLADRFALLAPEADLDFVPPSLPACVRHRKLQVVFASGFTSIRLSEAKRELSRAYKVPQTQVVVVAAAGPRTRLLISLPDTRPSVSGRHVLRRFRGASVRPFEQLDMASQRTWRWLACRFPPEQVGDHVSQAAAWGETRREVRRRAQLGRLSAALVVAAVGGAGYLLVRPWVPALRLYVVKGWHQVLSWLLPWAQFMGSVAFSAISLAWSSALFFGLSALGLRALPLWLDRVVKRQPRRKAWPWLRDGTRAALDRHPRLVGTLLNLLSSVLALGVLSAATGQPIDEWDLGIQGVITLVIEMIVLGVILKVRSTAPVRP